MSTAMSARLAAGTACLLAATVARHWLEAAMLRHMLLQLPLLLAAGWLLAGALASRAPAWLRRSVRLDQHGLCGLTSLLLVAYWMIPRALEQSLNAPLAECAVRIADAERRHSARLPATGQRGDPAVLPRQPEPG
jgi:hypothetical protein